ncbi:MAG: TolC family protein [Terracidiphilus sp.]|nr:TolC family protein [Terracidiphilus sp.]
MKSICVLAPFVLALSLVCEGQTELSSALVPQPALSLPKASPPLVEKGSAAVPLSVDEAVAEALQGNPEIRAAVRRLSLARLKTTTARSLDDPMLMVRDWDTPLRKPWDLNQAQAMVSLQQSFLSKQKRDLRGKLAGDDVEVASSELESLRQEVSAEVRKACADLMRNADEMKLNGRQASLLKEALAAALAQYTTGKVSQADVLRAQMALTRLNENLIELEEERDNARAQLNALRGSSPDEAIEIAGSYTSLAALPPIEELERTAIENRPELAALHKQIDKSRDQGQLTRLAMKPDFTVALGYMLMPTGSASRNAYMAELTMNLPSLNRARHDGEARQADAATDVSQAELEARTSAVFLEIRQAQIDLLAAQKRIRLYRDTLLPQADAAFKASAAAYQNNRTEFANLIDSQNLLLDIQSAFYKASAASDAGIAGLERAIGAPLAGVSEANAPAPGRTK